MSVPKKYHRIIERIRSFDLSMLDDSDLAAAVSNLRAELGNGKSSGYVLPQVFAIIREVIDRRLGIWKLFEQENWEIAKLGNWDAGTRGRMDEAYALIREKRKSLDDSQIHLSASFYKAIREMRRTGDGLTFWPYDVQLMGALALYEGKIAEMGTGEGKTVVAVFPACLWALSGKKVHIATVNDYLASRDCTWMGPAFRFMGLNVDCVLSYMTDTERRQAYKADIVYGNNYEFGFDYLRDNVKSKLEDRVQGKLDYVIIDEIDNILMDEATTPLIISGASESHTGIYWRFKPVVEALLEKQNQLIARLFYEAKMEKDSQSKSIKLVQVAMSAPWNTELLDYLSVNPDAHKGMRAIQSKFASARSEYKLEEELFYVVDEKLHTVKLTDRGMDFVEQQLGKGFMILPGSDDTPVPRRGEELRNLLQLLRAYVLFWKDEDYIIHNGGIIIVDEFTGRLAFGKKYEEGLHQAIECKEGLHITPENCVVGKITHPNYFRLYEKMTGMTATAHTEAEEFKKLYKLEVARISANRPVIRIDLPDRFYRTAEEKLQAIIEEIEEYHSFGRPVLVGTRSVEKSEQLSALLVKRGIPHNVLNAKNHAQEAEIIKFAGQPYAVTIATNMAGRGTDIALGDPSLGLHVIGTERHGARRIDDQLRGRSGRQGDIGSSRFFLSLQDDLFRVFGREEMEVIVKAFDKVLHNLQPTPGPSQEGNLESSLPGGGSGVGSEAESAKRRRRETTNLTRFARKAQRKSEEMSYHTRKYIIERDDIIDKQRRAIYAMRQEILTGEWTEAGIEPLIEENAADLINCGQYIDADLPYDDWNLKGLESYCISNFGVHVPLTEMSIEGIKRALVDAFKAVYDRREHALGTEFSCKLTRAAMINALETAWNDYISFQSEFDRALSLRSYVKGDTLTDYRLEVSKLFKDLLASIRREALKGIFTYPLPEEKPNSIRWAAGPRQISKQIKGIIGL